MCGWHYAGVVIVSHFNLRCTIVVSQLAQLAMTRCGRPHCLSKQLLLVHRSRDMLAKLRVCIIYRSTDFYIRTEFLTGDAHNIYDCALYSKIYGTPLQNTGGRSLRLLALSLKVDNLISMTHGQCNARSMVTFRHYSVRAAKK